MKIGILGDIHGNKYALESVLTSAKKEGVKELLITGDLVGYYPFAKEVLNLLTPWKKFVVTGNHEIMLKESMNNPQYLKKITRKYGSAINVALKTLSTEEIDYLINLPHPLSINLKDKIITLCHGSPVDVYEYVYPDTELNKLEWVNSHPSEIIICGHTHYPMLKKINNKTIINPGSVGQPRNNDKSAQWILFDTNDYDFKFKKEEYDKQEIINIVKKTDQNIPYLHEILKTK